MRFLLSTVRSPAVTAAFTNGGSTHTKTRVSRRDAVALVAVVAASLVTAIPCAVAQGIPLAIRGYDPVAYFTDGKPTRGVTEIEEYEWGGLRYRFSSAAHRELFKADPERYAPQFGNFCAMALSKGELVQADPENWLISDGKLYVFGKPVGPDLFRKDLAGNVAKAKQNRTLLPGH
jgi:YHS domain-containing protein